MSGEVIGGLVGGGASLLTIGWSVLRDRKGDKRESRQQDAASADVALRGFDALVNDLREEIERLRTQRQVDDKARDIREQALATEIARLRMEVFLLRRELASHGLAEPPSVIPFPGAAS